METNPEQYALPPGMWKEAEVDAQRLLDALTKDNALIDFVASRAALEALVINTEFPAEGLERFYQEIHGTSAPHSTWDDYDAGSRESISEIARGLKFR